MKRFDYSFLYNGMLPARLVNMTSGIYSFKSEDSRRRRDYRKVFDSLQQIARVQSVKSSNAIEGIVASDDRIRAIVTKSSAPVDHTEAEIAGYRDALDVIHTNWRDMDFTERNILSLHATMFAAVGYEQAGHYKQNDNLIIEQDAQGNRKVRFVPVPAVETPEAMVQLVLAYLDARSDPNINQLLLIPCVILDFLCIHPFADGNGRLSRLLSLLLLYRSGFDVCKYVSFEQQIDNYKSLYYQALQDSSVGWQDNANDYMPFVENFLATLYMCYKEMDRRFAVVNTGASKTNRIETTVLNSLVPISKAEICAVLPDVSPTTVESVLGKLVRQGAVVKVGAGSATRYIRK